ncbi:uncharacterized protein C8R40DRAFT_1065045 [Lentinula edodes]|uniref:uncharacterized protein n=1 Tax=Lentinula edodes TaxID=5353 RepID=UPI001E8DA816|nr:uncharacterized protein C8R40DRAFT_1065045 [Lentinula edodes]KAH7881359.1 hypothetical protein C8R40DRAFT_1065045 [Lentinula edodes]
MVNSCSILTALLVVGTVVLAVPIVPEGIISTGMPEGGTNVCGYFIMTSADFLRFLQQSDFSQEAEAWMQNPANPVSQSEPDAMMLFRENPHLLKAGLAHNHQEVEKDADFLRNYPLPENYRQLMDVFNRMHRQPNTDLSAEDIEYLPKLIRKMGDIHTLIVTYIQGNGPSGTTAKNLAEIREGFEKGEDLDKLMKLTKS